MWIKGCHWVISQWRRSRGSGENINKNWTSFQNWRQESTTGQRGFQEAAGDAEGQALALYCLWKLCLLYVLRLWFSEKLPTLATFHKTFRLLPNSCRRTLAGRQPKSIHPNQDCPRHLPDLKLFCKEKWANIARSDVYLKILQKKKCYHIYIQKLEIFSNSYLNTFPKSVFNMSLIWIKTTTSAAALHSFNPPF